MRRHLNVNKKNLNERATETIREISLRRWTLWRVSFSPSLCGTLGCIDFDDCFTSPKQRLKICRIHSRTAEYRVSYGKLNRIRNSTEFHIKFKTNEKWPSEQVEQSTNEDWPIDSTFNNCWLLCSGVRHNYYRLLLFIFIIEEQLILGTDEWILCRKFPFPLFISECSDLQLMLLLLLCSWQLFSTSFLSPK